MISIFKHLLFFLWTLHITAPIHLNKDAHLRRNKPIHDAYKDNLLVQNWYYGSIHPTQYRLRIFEIAAT